ncbi:MAG: hypothetical protein LBJ62_02700 [Bifidobacteriaceae bacterium]|nr:hypothetical protein [Bifidobacteriaceae bacterium]
MLGSLTAHLGRWPRPAGLVQLRAALSGKTPSTNSSGELVCVCLDVKLFGLPSRRLRPE